MRKTIYDYRVETGYLYINRATIDRNPYTGTLRIIYREFRTDDPNIFKEFELFAPSYFAGDEIWNTHLRRFYMLLSKKEKE